MTSTKLSQKPLNCRTHGISLLEIMVAIVLLSMLLLPLFHGLKQLGVFSENTRAQISRSYDYKLAHLTMARELRSSSNYLGSVNVKIDNPQNLREPDYRLSATGEHAPLPNSDILTLRQHDPLQIVKVVALSETAKLLSLDLCGQISEGLLSVESHWLGLSVDGNMPLQGRITRSSSRTNSSCALTVYKAFMRPDTVGGFRPEFYFRRQDAGGLYPAISNLIHTRECLSFYVSRKHELRIRSHFSDLSQPIIPNSMGLSIYLIKQPEVNTLIIKLLGINNSESQETWWPIYSSPWIGLNMVSR